MSCGVGCRYGLELELLWLWCGLVAVALIRPLAWKPPYAVGAAIKIQKKKKKKKKKAKLLLSALAETCQNRILKIKSTLLSLVPNKFA